jgi:ribonuclease-3
VIPLASSEELSVWVERSFGYAFTDRDLCCAALTHRSATGSNNERLEFLGDSVLNCVVAHMLYDAHREADEGALSRQRASLVSGETLAQISAELGVGEYLRLGSGELKSGGFRRASILANALEAILGAIFLDSGFDAAAAVVRRLMGPRLSDLPAVSALKDPKTRLQEALQARGLGLPVYTLDRVEGEAHAQTFAVSCVVASLGLSATADGGSRRRAEQLAADRVLASLPAELRSKT